MPTDTARRGRILRLLREIRGLSQRRVEHALRLTRTDLSGIELAKRRASGILICRLLEFYEATWLEVVLAAVILGYRSLPHSIENAIEDYYEISH
jgi:transcriptional regulator with XRE-family HTH domain